jgi:hypothetical protein
MYNAKSNNRRARLLTPLDALESLAALHNLLRAFLPVITSSSTSSSILLAAPELEEEEDEEAGSTTAAATTNTGGDGSGSSIYHGWGLEDENDAGAWEGDEEGVRRLSLAGFLWPADRSLDASVETVVERFPRCCWLEEQQPAVATRQHQAREAPF